MSSAPTSAGSANVPLTGKHRRELRARAHALKPVVWVAESGLTPAVVREIDRALTAHELIKIRTACTGNAQRTGLLQIICAQLEAQPVQVIGKILVAFRPKPEPSPPRPTVGGHSAQRTRRARRSTDTDLQRKRSPRPSGSRLRRI